MIRYLAKRIAVGIFTVYILVTITFFLMKIMPGSPFNSEHPMPAAVYEEFIKRYNMDAPIHEQYVDYLAKMMRGDFGFSFKRVGVSVTSLIATCGRVSLRLGAVAFVFSMGIGIGLGILTALSKNRVLHSAVQVLSTLGVSLPSFIVALLLMILFGVELRLLPIVGLESPRHFILPALSLALYPIAYISKLVKSSLSEVMRQDYIRMAKSKGLSDLTIVVKHALKNSLLPVVTYMGPLIAFLLTGSFVVETIFSIPGIGQEFVKSIGNRDYALIMGLTVYMGTLIVVFNIVCDFLCALIDPRVKLER